MRDTVAIQVNGRSIAIQKGTTVAAAMLIAGEPTRISVHGESRGALCGMGICFECRAVVDGTPHQRTCQMLCKDGMTVETDR